VSAIANQTSTTERVQDMKDALAETATEVKDEYGKVLGNIEQTIRRNPLAAAGIAAGVGLLIAVLARR
jgi:ElaB/YqjD/DUF883 family membrane-anchored ribosome-binding protein